VATAHRTRESRNLHQGHVLLRGTLLRRQPLITRTLAHCAQDTVREIPNRSAIRAFGTPSPASLLISAQSSKVITLQSLSAHYSPPKLSSFRAPPTMGRSTATLGPVSIRILVVDPPPTVAVTCVPNPSSQADSSTGGGLASMEHPLVPHFGREPRKRRGSKRRSSARPSSAGPGRRARAVRLDQTVAVAGGVVTGAERLPCCVFWSWRCAAGSPLMMSRVPRTTSKRPRSGLQG